MKRCPKCNTDYFDNMLEFCLDDGIRLSLLTNTEEEAVTITQSASKNPSTAKTFNIPFTSPVSPLKKESDDTLIDELPATKKLEAKVKHKSFEVLSITPIIIALLHNWLQWLYISNQNFNSIGAFLVSPNFLIWFLLLIGGAILGLLAIKYCEKKGFAYVSLVILSINLLLLLVPKR